MCGIDVSRCKVMGSKKKPLLLILKDADTGEDIELIVKVCISCVITRNKCACSTVSCISNSFHFAHFLIKQLQVGDDLRQDALIMQLLRVMSDLWKKEGLDMEMQLYDCISTGHERGLIKVVQNSMTLGKNIKMSLSVSHFHHFRRRELPMVQTEMCSEYVL